ncbi:hypothetical protein MMC19_005425 [Ptychographa xylographoides]|nr:hypothetical protein [Ptychographa xylographoides]
MPNRFSHAFVLANYEHRGWIDPANRIGGAAKNKYTLPVPSTTSASTPSPSGRHDTTVREPSATSTSTARSRPASVRPAPPSATPALHRANRARDTPTPPSPKRTSRLVTTTPIIDGAPPPVVASEPLSPVRTTSRRTSEHGSITSLRSFSSADRPTSSVVTQIYNPRRPPRLLIHDPDGDTCSTARAAEAVHVPLPHRSSPSSVRSRPRSLDGQGLRPPTLRQMSSASSRSSVNEPSLDLACLESPPVPASEVTAKHAWAAHRISLPAGLSARAEASSKRRRPTAHVSSLTTDDDDDDDDAPMDSSDVAMRPPRATPSPSISSLEDSDHDTELYFGDDSSEDGSPPISLPTSIESIKRTGGSRPSIVVPHTPHPSVDVQAALGVRPNSRAAPSPPSLRGYSPDDAAPPPIARVRRGDGPAPSSPKALAAPPEQLPIRTRSSSVTRRLGAFKPSFLGASLFSSKPSKASAPSKPSEPSKASTPSEPSKPSKASTPPAKAPIMAVSPTPPVSTLSVPSRPRFGSKRSPESAASIARIESALGGGKLTKKAQKDLLACSVAYEKARQARSPIMTADVRNLMPIGRGWIKGPGGGVEAIMR